MGTKSEQNEVVLHLCQVRMNTPAHSCYFQDYSNSQTKTRVAINANAHSKDQDSAIGSFTNVPGALSIRPANWIISIADSMAEMCMLKNFTLSFPKTRNFYMSN